MRTGGGATLLLGSLAMFGCRTGRNYLGAEGPRYAGVPGASRTLDRLDSTRLRVTSFNIVYYPALLSLRTQRNFGNAVLSRWPIVGDGKIVLPHVSRFSRTQRTATVATIRVGSRLVHVYSTHLGTMSDVAPASRREQLQAILADAALYQRVVIGGDMNDEGVGRVARERGYAWPTQHGPATHPLGRLDHIFLRGLTSPANGAAGTVLDARGSSDHLPVWAVATLQGPSS